MGTFQKLIAIGALVCVPGACSLFVALEPLPTDGTAALSAPACDFNAFYQVRIHSFQSTAPDDASVDRDDDGGRPDAGFDAGEEASGASRARMQTTTISLVNVRAAKGVPIAREDVSVEEGAGDTVLDVRLGEASSEIDVDTTSSNQFLLRIALPSGSAFCPSAGSSGGRPVTLDVRLFDDGSASTVRAIVPGEPDVPVPIR